MVLTAWRFAESRLAIRFGARQISEILRRVSGLCQLAVWVAGRVACCASGVARLWGGRVAQKGAAVTLGTAVTGNGLSRGQGSRTRGEALRPYAAA